MLIRFEDPEGKPLHLRADKVETVEVAVAGPAGCSFLCLDMRAREGLLVRGTPDEVAARLGAPDVEAMRKALEAVRDRAAQAGQALPSGRTAAEVAVMGMDVSLPSAILRQVLSALGPR